jgi:hypothetical protein
MDIFQSHTSLAISCCLQHNNLAYVACVVQYCWVDRPISLYNLFTEESDLEMPDELVAAACGAEWWFGVRGGMAATGGVGSVRKRGRERRASG